MASHDGATYRLFSAEVSSSSPPVVLVKPALVSSPADALRGVSDLFARASPPSASSSASSSFEQRRQMFETQSLLSIPMLLPLVPRPRGPSDESSSPSDSDDNNGDDSAAASPLHVSSPLLFSSEERRLGRDTKKFVDRLYALSLDEGDIVSSDAATLAIMRGGRSASSARTASLSLALDAVVLDPSCAAALCDAVTAGDNNTNNRYRGESAKMKRMGGGGEANVDLVPTSTVRPFLSSLSATGIGLATSATGDMATNGLTAIVSCGTGAGGRGGGRTPPLVETLLTLFEALCVSASFPPSPAKSAGASSMLLLPVVGDTQRTNNSDSGKKVLLGGTPVVVLCPNTDAALHMAMALHSAMRSLETSVQFAGQRRKIRFFELWIAQ